MGISKRISGKNARSPMWMSKELMGKLRDKKGSLQRVKAGTGSLGGIQRHCLSRQGPD